MSMMGLDALTSYANTQASQNDTSALESKLNADLSDASDEELLSVCKDFESYFLEQVLKQVEKTVKFDKDDENSYASQMVDYFKDTAIQTISDEITDQEGGSFAQMMYEQMKRNYNL